MDYTVSEEAQLMRAELERFLRAQADVEAMDDSIGRDCVGATVHQHLAASGWIDLVASPAGTLVDAIYVAEAFGTVLVPASASTTIGFLLPLMTSLGGEVADEVIASVRRGELVAVPLPKLQRGPAGSWRWGWSSGPRGESGDGKVTGPVFDRLPEAPGAGLLLLPLHADGPLRLVLVTTDSPAVTIDPQPSLDMRWSVGRVQLTADAVDPDVAAGSGPVAGAIVDTADRRLSAAVQHAAVRLSLLLDAEAVGGAQELLRRTVAYVSHRQQFGRPVGSFQALRHRVADMAILTENARSLLYHAAWQVQTTGPQEALTDVAASRLYAAEAYRQVCESAIQCHGGIGFTWEQGIHLFYRAALTARALLTDVDGCTALLAEHVKPAPHKSPVTI